jgi:hypothetical protein
MRLISGAKLDSRFERFGEEKLHHQIGTEFNRQSVEQMRIFKVSKTTQFTRGYFAGEVSNL